MTTTSDATFDPSRDAEFGADAFAMLSHIMHHTSQVAAGDRVSQLNDTLVRAYWADDCIVDVRRESLVSRDVTVVVSVGLDAGLWLLARKGSFTVTDAGAEDYEFSAIVSDFASLDRVMQELIELRAVCSGVVVSEEILAFDFGAKRCPWTN
jgi:hypothetical protein